MSRLFKRRRSNASSLQQQLPFADEGLSGDSTPTADGADPVTTRPSANFSRARSGSAAGLSSSYKTPTRSYIHHAGHGHSEFVQYSSSGVREQTAELSSSFLSDPEFPGHSDSPTRPQHSRHSNSIDLLADDYERLHRRPEAIEERSEPSTEPTTPERESPPQTSALTELIRTSPPDEVNAQSSQAAQKSGERSRPTMTIPEVVVDSPKSPNAPTEESPLLPRGRLSSPSKKHNDDDEDQDLEGQAIRRTGTWHMFKHSYPSLPKLAARTFHVASNPKSWDMKQVVQKTVVKPASVLPAVFLGLLLNLLDALSYGSSWQGRSLVHKLTSVQASFFFRLEKKFSRAWAQTASPCSTSAVLFHKLYTLAAVYFAEEWVLRWYEGPSRNRRSHADHLRRSKSSRSSTR